jgi:hypothetical protein
MVVMCYIGRVKNEEYDFDKEKSGMFDRFKPIFEKHWENINDAEIFSQLKQIIGKNNIINF